ncbi:general odorant-binding protein 57c-like [Periplaneta americana]|uniref:general odorant-binding protein 57c-like n=1 Tax=Periplaneta americana TaxID=6978 RepID=UPI0037E81E92
MSTTLVCFVCCLAMGIVTGRTIYSESPSISDMDNDLAVIKFCNMTSPISLVSMNSVLVNKRLSGVDNVEGFKCFLHCLYNKYNWMDMEGGFLLANMKSSLEATHMNEIVSDWVIYKCSAVDSSDRCERAFKFTECFWAETKTFPDDDESTLYNAH